MTKLDKESIIDGYQDVRDDQTSTTWIVLSYNENNVITVTARGSDFNEFRQHFNDDGRGFGYIRMITGDELSHRSKFAFIHWVGPNVGALQRARSSTEKGEVKEIIQNFAVECMFEGDDEEFSENYIRNKLIKAGGANYGSAK